MLFLAELTVFDCGGEFILKVINFVMTLLDIVFFMIPVILIVMVSIDFVKNVMASDEGGMKKNNQLILKRFIMCVALFLVNPIVDFSISLLGNLGVNYAQCIAIATSGEDLSQYKLDLFPGANEPSTTPDIKKPTDPGFVPSGKGDSSTGSSNNSVSNVNATFLIGDSRFVGMKSAVDVSGDKIEWIAKSGQGYNWLNNTAINTLNSKIKSDKKYNIVINLGVNDLGNVDNYLKLYNGMVNNSKYKNSNIVIVSVNPIDDAKYSGYASDAKVQTFNKKLKSDLSSSIKYCDTYAKIKNNFGTNDGLHYTNSTYQKIYNMIGTGEYIHWL